MKKHAKEKNPKKNLKVKDLDLKGTETKNVKGGGVGPCFRGKK
jgi:hypothetical protein